MTRWAVSFWLFVLAGNGIGVAAHLSAAPDQLWLAINTFGVGYAFAALLYSPKGGRTTDPLTTRTDTP